MKRVILFAALLVSATTVWCQVGIRNISSVSIDLYFNDADGSTQNGGRVEKLFLDINQELLFDIADWLSAELKIQRQDEQPYASAAPAGWHETTISVAPIFITTPYTYFIMRYGLGIGTGYERPAGEAQEVTGQTGLSHDLTIDANFESESVSANLTLRGSLYPDLDYWFVVPSAGIRATVANEISLSTRYFFSLNSAAVISHATVVEVEFPLTDRLRLKAGGSANVTPSADPDSRWGYTVITGLAARITDTLNLRYHLEYLGRQGNGPGIRNLLVLDARF